MPHPAVQLKEAAKGKALVVPHNMAVSQIRHKLSSLKKQQGELDATGHE